MIFLRPWFLLFLIFIPLLFVYIKTKEKNYSTWQKVIDKELLNFLKIKNTKKSSNLFWYAMFFSLLLSVIGISGPSIKKTNIKNFEQRSAAMIAIDLSKNTSSKDLEKYKFAIYDIINQTTSANLGLIVFADEPYIIAPITQDKNIIKNLLKEINHSIMPTAGQDIKKAKNFANQKLIDAGFYNGQTIVLSNSENIDINTIINKLNNQTKELKESPNKSKNWLDIGYYFLIFPAIFCLYLFRKGLFVILLFISFNAQANIFLNANEEGIKAFNKKDYKTAIKKFNDKDWLASSLYKNGNYKEAINLFSDEYNQGNALAKSGKIKEAIKKYENVLRKNPNHKDAKFNLEYLKQQQQQNQNQNQGQNQKDQQKNQNNNKNNNQDNKTNADSKTQKEEQIKTTPQEQKNTQESKEKAQAYSESDQAKEQQYREIPEDPGGLLRAYINKQHQQRLRGL